MLREKVPERIKRLGEEVIFYLAAGLIGLMFYKAFFYAFDKGFERRAEYCDSIAWNSSKCVQLILNLHPSDPIKIKYLKDYGSIVSLDLQSAEDRSEQIQQLSASQ